MIRLILISLLFLISLLTICKAPAYYLWLLAIMVTEFPWVFAGIVVLLLISGFWVQKYQLAATITGLVALGLFLSPIVRAYIISNSLNRNFSAVFDLKNPTLKGENDHPPFSFLRQFAKVKVVSYQTLTYVTYPDISLTLDFYPSQKGHKKPCVVVVHGGSWSSGDSKQLPELNSRLAALGYNIASINYRMAPKYQTPAPVEDIHAAMSYLRKHADELQIDTNNFVLLGRSAGAQIALLAAYTSHEKGLKAVIDFYGPADMVWGYSIPTNPLIMDSRKVMSNYIGGRYGQVPEKYAACSPIEFVNRQSVPTLILHGQNDVLVAYEHSRRLNQKLDANGIKHFWLQLPWATHGFDYNLNGPGGQLSTYAVERFLNEVTK